MWMMPACSSGRNSDEFGTACQARRYLFTDQTPEACARSEDELHKKVQKTSDQENGKTNPYKSEPDCPQGDPRLWQAVA